MSKSALLALCVLVLPCTAAAQVPLIDSMPGPEGFGVDCLSPNDDGSSAVIDLTAAFPGGLEFFGRRHTTMFVNTNGNITFTRALSTYTPNPFPIAMQPMIAPYWSDVDIRGSEGCSGSGGDQGCRNPTENGVWWHLEAGRVVVTWHEVGHYSCEDGEKMSFQLILAEALYCGVEGDFDVEFRYNRCQWEAGGASGDEDDDGICSPGEGFPRMCVPAQVGFDAGNLADFVSVPGSRMTGIHTRMCSMSNVGIPGVWRFQIRSGQVSCPDAGRICDTGAEGICGEGRNSCMGAGTVCEQTLDPTTESCNAADDDCDGTTDEGDLCPDEQLCYRGGCIDPCFEGGCPTGEVCTEAGVCAEVACETVECEPGQRCVDGACVDACDDSVVCPTGQTCRFGRCQDLCETLECDACSVCNEGVCSLHCIATGCPTGQRCEENGVCVEDACHGVRCGPARTCREGTCVDACLGVICPAGELCRLGECVPRSTVDAGPEIDAGPRPDAGTPRRDGGPVLSDASVVDGGVAPIDAGGDPPDDGGCGCRAVGVDGGGGLGGLATLMLAALVLARRRRTR